MFSLILKPDCTIWHAWSRSPAVWRATMSLDQMVLAGFPLRCCFRHPLWGCLLSFPRFVPCFFKFLLFDNMQSFLNPKIIFDDSFSLRLADRRATARTTNFVEPCSFQQKKITDPYFSFLTLSFFNSVLAYIAGIFIHRPFIYLLEIFSFFQVIPSQNNWQFFTVSFIVPLFSKKIGQSFRLTYLFIHSLLSLPSFSTWRIYLRSLLPYQMLLWTISLE